MKQFITVSIAALFAFSAVAQVPMGRPDRNGIVYSMSGQPPVVRNNRIIYPAGAPYVDASGTSRACRSQLVVNHANGNARAVCADKPAVTTADAYSQMAPAAGGPHTRSDRNLLSDSKSGLRNDRAIIGQEILP